MLWRDEIPVYEHVDEAGAKTKVTVIAGKFNEVKAPDPAPNSWAADSDNQVAIWTITMEAGAKWTIQISSGKLYFIAGQ